MVAFFAICTFSLLAAGSGLVALSQVGGALTRVTEERVPQTLSWLELSRLVERVLRAAPTLLAAASEDERAAIAAAIAADTRQLDGLLRQGAGSDVPAEDEAARQVAQLVAQLTDNLVELEGLIQERLRIVARREALVGELLQTTAVAVRILAPGARILEAQTSEWQRTAESPAGLRDADETLALAGSIVALIPQQRAAALVDSVQNTLLQVTAADTIESVDLLVFKLRRAIDQVSELAERLPERIRGRMVKEIGTIGTLAAGPASLVRARRDELGLIDRANALLAINAQISAALTEQIDVLIGRTKAQLAAAQGRAERVRGLTTTVLVGLVATSFLSSILIVWLYVGRNVIARLTALSDSMLAIARGDLRAPLPAAGGGDEIARMAAALAVFRDTAIEIEESNLREIAAARRRLVDAIESSSDGFAFYDDEDRLVLCNRRYKELLDPGQEAGIEPGVSFEVTVRRAAESGRVVAAQGRVEAWVAERLAFHRHPGEAQVQERSDGRWLLVSERKTSDNGTVAVYSDITALKQHEQELAKQSQALQQLSSQLAKYLSPQLYASIFSGKQQVKIVSQRKRLTVFFSDIADFTETTERMQPEDLTRLLNHYLTEMSQIALAHGATIDKYVGDAIVAFFGDPETRGVDEDAVACVKMAIAMRKRLVELQHAWRDSGIERPLRCRIGINTGICTVGNFGSESRMDYTIIGSAVNLAARLERACPVGEILISYETHAHVKRVIACEEQGEIAAKGVGYPIATYRVIDLHENLDPEQRPIHASLDHLQLDVDVAEMSVAQRREAAALLRQAAARLVDSTDGG